MHQSFSSRNKKRRRLHKMVERVSYGIVVFLIVFTTFVGFLMLYPLIMLLPTSISIGYRTIPIDWSSLGDMSNVAMLSVVVIGTLFAYQEYIGNQEQRRRERAESEFNLYKQVNDWLMEPKAIEARRWVIVNIPTLEEMNGDATAWLDNATSRINQMPRGSKGKRPLGLDHIKTILNSFESSVSPLGTI